MKSLKNIWYIKSRHKTHLCFGV